MTKILIIDDHDEFRRMLHRMLTQAGDEVIETSSGKEALSILRSDDPPKIAILDWMMPEMDGMEVCQKIRKEINRSYTYVILLTAKETKEDILKGLAAGADDYIVKPFDTGELEARLRAGKRIIDLQDKLEMLATHDPLTEILNRGAIFDTFEKEHSRAQRKQKPMSVIMADIDYFKRVNDTYGHTAGDQVLCEVVRRMSGSLRPYDSIGRYGGEEFLVILPDCDRDGALQLAERLRESVCKEKVNILDKSIEITISIGVSELNSTDIKTPKKQLLVTVDEALYKAKSKGRNRVEVL